MQIFESEYLALARTRSDKPLDLFFGLIARNREAPAFGHHDEMNF